MSQEHKDYWDSFYESRNSSAVPQEPSAFTTWVQDWLTPERPIVEVGFGNGRDSLWFARQGRTVTGYDFAPSAVRQAQGRSDGEGLGVGFVELDLYDDAATRAVEKVLAEYEEPALYGRFLIHALETRGRLNLFDLAAVGLVAGGDILLEFRTGHDQATQHVFGDNHFRNYLNPGGVINELVERGGRIVHLETGHGMALYKTEDPHVARLVARFGEQ